MSEQTIELTGERAVTNSGKVMLKDGEYDDQLIPSSTIEELEDNVQLVKRTMRRDDRTDREIKMDKIKEEARAAAEAKKAATSTSAGTGAGGSKKKKLEKAIVLEQYFKLEDKDEVIRAVSDNWNKNKDIENLKNKLFAMCVLLPNLGHLLPANDDDDEKKDKVDKVDKKIGLPVPSVPTKDGDQFDATMAYYKPEGYLSGNEDQIDEFIRQKILREPGQQMHLLREVYTILATHFSMKEIKAERKRGEELKQALLDKEAAITNSTAAKSATTNLTTTNETSTNKIATTVDDLTKSVSATATEATTAAVIETPTSTSLAPITTAAPAPLTIEELREKLKAKLKAKSR